MIQRLWMSVRALVRRGAVEREMCEEMQQHLERATERLMARGLSRDEAQAAARLEFGNVGVIQEHARDARGVRWIEELVRDTRYAARGLRRTPGFAIAVVLTLALGIGANTAIFGVVDRLLLRAPAYLRDPERVHRIYQTATYNGTPSTQGGSRFPRYIDFRRFTQSFESITAFATTDVAVGDGENARERPVTAASASYFDLFDARPILGRFFTAAEDEPPKGAPVVVLSYAYWQSAYGGRADALGQRIRIGRTLCTIIGVAPPGFVGLVDQRIPAMFEPITTYAWDRRGSDIRPNYDYTTNYAWFWLELVARRKPGVTIEAANADLTHALELSWRAEARGDARGETRFRAAHAHADLGPIQLQRGPEAGPEAKVVLWVFGVAFIVLLIACANVANLLLARAVARRREIALRLALGVSRSRLARQLLVESFMLAILGGLAGIVVAHWGGAVVRRLFLPSDGTTTALADGRMIGVTLVATIAVAVLTGLAPLSQALRYRLSQSLNAGGRDTGGRSSALRTSLLVVQVMLSVVLLVGAGLFVRSLDNVRSVRLGFDVDPLVVVDQNLRGGKFTTAERESLELRLLDEVRTMPGVTSATRSPSVPYWGFEGRDLFVPGVDSVMTLGEFFMQPGDADFFRTYGARIIRGRGFDESDVATSAPVMVVSEGMAETLWRGVDPIGKCVRIEKATAPCAVVVGVAEEMRIHSFDGLGSRDRRGEYTYEVPMTQYGAPAGTIIVRVAGNGADYADAIRRRLQPLMPGAAYVTTTPLRSMVDPKMQGWRLGATMFAVFAGLAIVLAGIGLYSVMAYGVVQRRQEIGVRIALGASRARVVRMIARGALRVVAVGTLLGALAALAAAPWAKPLLFQESANDPLVFGIVAAVLVCVGLVATAIPAMSACGVDPNVALRTD